MTTTPTAVNSWTARIGAAVPAVAYVIAGLTLVQALLAGRYLFQSMPIMVHGIIGNVVFMVALALAVAATIGRTGARTIVASWILLLLMFAQVGLGYAGRTAAVAASWHIPNGVAALGLAVFIGASGIGRRRD